MSNTSANILTDLDTLLDTRQGCLSKLLSKEALADFVSSKEYMLRERDDFPNVNMKKFRGLYDSRDKETISNSMVSYMFNVVKSKLINLLTKSNYNDDIKEVNLLINFYPFELTEAETNTVIDIVFRKMGIKTFIKPVYRTLEELSPAFLESNNIENTLIYDTNEWLNLHGPALVKNPIPHRSLHLPGIVVNKASEEDMAKFNKVGFKDIFSYMEYMYATGLALDYLPIMFYGNIITVSAELEKLRREGVL